MYVSSASGVREVMEAIDADNPRIEQLQSRAMVVGWALNRAEVDRLAAEARREAQAPARSYAGTDGLDRIQRSARELEVEMRRFLEATEGDKR